MNNINVVLFVSRNKDNKDLPGFKERRVSFITDKTAPELYDRFDQFVKQGQQNELSRFYYSVNRRDNEKINRELIKFLIDNPDYPSNKIKSKLVSIANKPSSVHDKLWLLDIDTEDTDVILEIKQSLLDFNTDWIVGNDFTIISTLNGAHIISRPFDTRKLLEKYGDVLTVKKDDMYLLGYDTKK